MKVDADDERGRTQALEFDAFGEVGDWVMKNVTVGETLAITARLEQRTYRERGEEVDELRIVAVRMEPVVRRGSGGIGGRHDGDERRRPHGATQPSTTTPPSTTTAPSTTTPPSAGSQSAVTGEPPEPVVDPG